MTTGPVSSSELVEAGADAVLDSLLEFPGWLDGYLAAQHPVTAVPQA